MQHQKVEDFQNFTGASRETAERYLDMSQMDLEAAVSLFMDMPEGEASQPPSSAAADPSLLPPEIPDEEEVPLPLQDYHDRLLDSRSPISHTNSTPSHVTTDYNRIFHLPEGKFHGSFEEAKYLAKNENKQLLVYLYDAKSFPCLQVNRDILSKDVIKEVIGQSFIFYVKAVDSEDGKLYLQLYNKGVIGADVVPFIAAIDPRTGLQMKRFTQPQLENMTIFLESLIEHLDSTQNSRKSPPRSSRDESAESPTTREPEALPSTMPVEHAEESPQRGYVLKSTSGNASDVPTVKCEGVEMLKALREERLKRMRKE